MLLVNVWCGFNVTLFVRVRVRVRVRDRVRVVVVVFSSGYDNYIMQTCAI